MHQRSRRIKRGGSRMKVTRMVLHALLLLVIPIMEASAQSERIHVAIPFAFAIGEITKEAGEYDIQYQNNGVVVLRETRSKRAFVFQANPTWTKGDQRRPFLRFHRYGDQYFLAELGWPGYDIGRAVIPS